MNHAKIVNAIVKSYEAGASDAMLSDLLAALVAAPDGHPRRAAAAPAAPVAALPTVTHDRAVTALCLWECMLEMKRDTHILEHVFATLGTVEMRDVALRLAAIADAAFQTLSIDESETIGAFDWEYCPAFIRVVDWVGIAECDGTGGIVETDMRKLAVCIMETAKRA